MAIVLALPLWAQPELRLDGELTDEQWRAATPVPLRPAFLGVPADLGGEVRVVHLQFDTLVGAYLPEPGGRVLARSVGVNPVWEKDALESPDLEDRLIVTIGEQVVEVNPWGAWRAPAGLQVVAAARIDSSGWWVECAIAAFGNVQVERVRSRRALAPEFRWTARVTHVPSNANAQKVQDTRTAGARVGRLSSLSSEDAWKQVPAFQMLRNEPEARRPRYPTNVRWAHDGQKLVVRFEVDEPEPVVARAGGRDANIAADDHVGIYLAISGSAFLEILVNPSGALRDTRGSGPRMSRPDANWNAPITVETAIEHKHWWARIEIPLAECTRALGEQAMPKLWRTALVRHRAARPGREAEWSAYPAIGASNSFYGPARYAALLLDNSPPLPLRQPEPKEYSGFAEKLAALDSDVWTPLERRFLGVRGMTGRYLDRRVREAVLAERTAWAKVQTKTDWERFRDERIQNLRESMGQFPPERPSLDTRVSARYSGPGYKQENVAFQVRRDYWMPANVYTPANATGKLPAILIVHSQHYPKTQGELHDMGHLWARTGALVMIVERPGYGERAETNPWFRQAYGSRDNFTKLLFLAGESYSAWAAWDIIRSVDYLYDRPDVDRQKIILLGSVAGGGEPSALAAALDERITAVAPYNYDQGHVRVHGDSPGQIAKQFSPWLVAASIAPRRLIRAFEFGWEGAEEPDYPELWVDGMERSRKVWDWYGAGANLTSAQGFGLIRLSMERASHCFSIGPEQRESLYPILQRWFGIPYPSAEDRAILPDSGLTVNRVREEARKQEAQRRRPHAELVSITPELNAQIRRRSMHELLGELADQMHRTRDREKIVRELPKLLGDIEPAARPEVEPKWRKTVGNVNAEAMVVTVEEGIRVPVLLLRPQGSGAVPVVVAVSQGGKERFLQSRAEELASLLDTRLAVALVDVRGAGETAAAWGGTPNGLAQTEFDLDRNLLGSRVKDLRTVLAVLRTYPDIDANRIGLWGESFSSPNQNLFVDEVEFEGAPNVQYKADPMGAHLALLTALFEGSRVRAISGSGGLVSYRSALNNSVTYMPMDTVVRGILRVADLSDIISAIGHTRVAWLNAVDGRNVATGVRTPPHQCANHLIQMLSARN